MQKIKDPLVVAVGVVHASRNQEAVEPFKVSVLWHASALFRDDEDLVCLDSQGRVVFLASRGKMVVNDLAERALLRLRVRVRQIGLEDHEAHDRRVGGRLEALLHDRSLSGILSGGGSEGCSEQW